MKHILCTVLSNWVDCTWYQVLSSPTELTVPGTALPFSTIFYSIRSLKVSSQISGSFQAVMKLIFSFHYWDNKSNGFFWKCHKILWYYYYLELQNSILSRIIMELQKVTEKCIIPFDTKYCANKPLESICNNIFPFRHSAPDWILCKQLHSYWRYRLCSLHEYTFCNSILLHLPR